MLRPGAEFWCLWARAAIVAALACLFMLTHPLRAETLLASFYGAESGRVTASGAFFRPMGLTAAHPTWPFGTRFRACLVSRCGVGTVTDRGPARWTGRGIDLSRGLARAIGLEPRGVARVHIDRLHLGANHARRSVARRRRLF